MQFIIKIIINRLIKVNYSIENNNNKKNKTKHNKQTNKQNQNKCTKLISFMKLSYRVSKGTLLTITFFCH